MKDLTTIVIKAIENLRENREDGVFENVLIDVAKGFAFCGFFQCKNWRKIIEFTFDENILAVNISTEQTLANDKNDISQVFNDYSELANFLLPDWNEKLPTYLTDNIESYQTFNQNLLTESEMEICRSEWNVIPSSTDASNEIHTPHKSNTASNEMFLLPSTHASNPQIPAAPLNNEASWQHVPIYKGKISLSSSMYDRGLNYSLTLNGQYEKQSTHTENNVETIALFEKQRSNVEVLKKLTSEIVNKELLMDEDVESQNTNLTPPIRRISSAEDLLAELLLLSSDDDTLISSSDETNRIHGQHNSDISVKTTSPSNKHTVRDRNGVDDRKFCMDDNIRIDERHYPCGYQNFDSQLPTKQVEQTGERLLSHSVCSPAIGQPAGFENMQHLRQRLKVRSNGKPSEKSYVCHVCDKAFQNRSILAIHKKFHKDQKPHVCDVCQRAFRQLSSLLSHKWIHSDEKPYVCDVCPKSYTHSSNLMYHKRIHTGEKPHVCDVCQRAFRIPANLAIHKRIHTSEKRYVCDVCHRRFRHFSSLLRHKRIHSGEKPYVCDVCQKSFRHYSTLSKHRTTQHG